MAEKTTLADAEAAVVAVLSDLAVDDVCTEVPEVIPSTMLRVALIGGPPKRDRVIDLPLVSVEAWAGTATEAWSLMADADAAMDAINTKTPQGAIRHCAQNVRPYRSDDPTTGRPRYLARYQLTMRATTTTS